MNFRLFTDLVLRSSAAISSTAYSRHPGGGDTSKKNKEIYEQLRDGVLRPCVRIVRGGITQQLVPTLLSERRTIDDEVYNVGVINTFYLMPYYAEHKINSKPFLMTGTKKCREKQKVNKHVINTFRGVDGNAINFSVAKQADYKKNKNKNNANSNDPDSDTDEDDDDTDTDVVMKQKTKKIPLEIFSSKQ